MRLAVCNFTGDLNNDFLVLDTKTGEVLYRFNTGGSIGGGVVTYTYYSKQYVATPLGTVSAFFWRVGTAGNCCLRTSLGAAHDAWVKSLAQQGAQL